MSSGTKGRGYFFALEIGDRLDALLQLEDAGVCAS